jgi:predicted dehydrogenase
LVDLKSGRVRAAVIGSGFVGPYHVDAVRRTGLGEVVVLAGRDLARTKAVAWEAGVPRATTSVDDVLGDPSLDVVHVCTTNDSHVELGRAVLEARKHLVLEKPIAVGVPGAASLLADAAVARCHAMVPLTYRGYPIVQHARGLVRDDRLGSIRLIHGHYVQDWLARAQRRQLARAIDRRWAVSSLCRHRDPLARPC